MSTTGLIQLYYDFREVLRRERKKIAALQLTGRLEEYLTHEFGYHIYRGSRGRLFVITNYGAQGQSRIDIVVLKPGKPDGQPYIKALVEAKYLRNAHRLGDHTAHDETRQALSGLARQLKRSAGFRHGEYEVRLSARRKEIYGLVFGSYVAGGARAPRLPKDEFYQDCLDRAIQAGLRYHDLNNPAWREVFDDVDVAVLGRKYQVSLKMGLWRLAE